MEQPNVEEFTQMLKEMKQNQSGSAPLFLVGDLTEPNYGVFMLQMAQAEQDGWNEVNIKLTSNGGNISLGFALYDALRAAPFSSVVECFGYCASAAVLPLMAANDRGASKNCRFLLHEAFMNIDEPTSLGKKNLNDHHNELERLINDYCAVIAKRSKMPVSKVKELCKNETSLSAKEALKLNLIDYVI